MHDDYNIFCYYRSSCKRLIKRDFYNYTNNLEQNSIENPQFFWNYSSKNLNNKIPNSMHFKSQTANNGIDIANFLNCILRVFTMLLH